MTDPYRLPRACSQYAIAPGVSFSMSSSCHALVAVLGRSAAAFDLFAAPQLDAAMHYRRSLLIDMATRYHAMCTFYSAHEQFELSGATSSYDSGSAAYTL